MNADKAPPFLKGGYPLFTNKFPPQSVVQTTLTFDPKTVSFKG